ncbi:hypothetical protein DFH08DRAFT_830332 [Mycena albidolilacea]|uniref:Uncharacterized protein n=1 Tax=Mycena albidolilacea TaxID=1033008 RepID=A0AAD7F410_9AGAR|nr:hypothetical protein DFH08DRAFT_830332 [Mycena albidolilacea]
MGSNYSKPPQAANSDAAVPTSIIAFDPPYFWPTTANVLVIETCHSMGGISLVSALLYSPHMSAGGIAIDGRGRLCSVPEDRWKELEGVVRDAKEVWAVLGNHSYWSRPQIGSCPVSLDFDLGPSDHVEGLCAIQRTAHMVSAENLVLSTSAEHSITLPVPKNNDILTYKKNADGTYEKTTVDRIPEPIKRLESELSKLEAELFPRSSGESEPFARESDAEAMVSAIKTMSSAVRRERQLVEKYASAFRRKAQTGWFNW